MEVNQIESMRGFQYWIQANASLSGKSLHAIHPSKQFLFGIICTDLDFVG